MCSMVSTIISRTFNLVSFLVFLRYHCRGLNRTFSIEELHLLICFRVPHFDRCIAVKTQVNVLNDLHFAWFSEDPSNRQAPEVMSFVDWVVVQGRFSYEAGFVDDSDAHRSRASAQLDYRRLSWFQPEAHPSPSADGRLLGNLVTLSPLLLVINGCSGPCTDSEQIDSVVDHLLEGNLAAVPPFVDYRICDVIQQFAGKGCRMLACIGNGVSFQNSRLSVDFQDLCFLRHKHRLNLW